MKLHLIVESTSPSFNLALEEYFLQHKEDDYFFCYINKPSVIIGKHQNTFNEAQIDFCKKNNIAVHRRLSGGGTVYHGPGNLNFTFIETIHKGKPLIDFQRFLNPIINALESLGIEAKYSGRNDLLVNGLKISGNAEHVYAKKSRVIHHGTLLFDADLSYLKKAISQKTHFKFNSHAVSSVRSKVLNIKSISGLASIDQFKVKIQDHVSTSLSYKRITLTEKEIVLIENIEEEKYKQDSWNFGYTPKFKCALKHELFLNIPIQFEILKNNIIHKCSIIQLGKEIEISELRNKIFSAESIFKNFPFNQVGINEQPSIVQIKSLF